MGSSAERPNIPSAGAIRWNTTLGGLEYSNGTYWTVSGLPDGSSEGLAAASAASIKTLTGTTTDARYWINIPNLGPRQVYCDMNSYGGGWMLAMRLDSTLGVGTVRHYFSSAWWTNATSSLSAAPTNARTNGELKTEVYSYYPHSEVMLEYGYGASYFASVAKARYTQPVATNQQNVTMLAKQQATYHEGGGKTFNGFTTEQYRWTRQETNDATFFPNSYLHINFGSHAAPSNFSNDFFRFWFNNVPDTSLDSPACNQIGGFGMCGDFSPTSPAYSNPSTWNPSTIDLAYNAGNASATISPPYGSNPGTCQWNDTRTMAGTSGILYNASTTVRISSNYYNNGVALIWVR